MINTYNGAVLRDVGGIEISKSSDNPRFAVTLNRSTQLADTARMEAILVAKSELETQRFINAVYSANRFSNLVQIHIF